jgi:hypothetical protein
VFEASHAAYAPEYPLILAPASGATFGESFNPALNRAFETNDEVVISNDDVVLHPNTMPDLMRDVDMLKSFYGDKLGIVATYSDNIRDIQNIRNVPAGLVPECKQVERLSPVFAWISKKAFMDAQFPPLNWYADDVICEDLNALGYKHFVSRAYLHHIGSQTIGTDTAALNAASMPWLQANRPQYVQKWFGGTP